MKRRFTEWLSLYIVKKPAKVILLGILLFNVILLAVSALMISALAPASLEYSGFWESVFYTVSMILDAGCIQFIIMDIGEASVFLILVCIVIILLGMITFTGAVIGYVTNYISSFIENSQSGTRVLKISNHTVILNWNSRASEIINDMLYTQKKEVVVILVSEGAEKIEKEIEDRITVTLKTENDRIHETAGRKSLFERMLYLRRNLLRNNITVIIREGDTYSTKQLYDISLLQAKNVIILGKDVQNTMCKYETLENINRYERGNSNTIKTLVQVAEITGSEESLDDQVIIVEVDDNWTANLVNRIIAHKEHFGKCNIIPLPVNKILGEILSQFSIMPELNFVYSELFSNKGAEFFCHPQGKDIDEKTFIKEYLSKHNAAIPLTFMDTKTGKNIFYVANNKKDYTIEKCLAESNYKVKLNREYWLEQRNIVILGHNSNSIEIMEGFNAIRAEWNKKDGSEILKVIVIDDKKNLEKRNYYSQYPYVKKTIEADIYDDELIKNSISEFLSENDQDTSILILSDDSVLTEDIDSNVLTYLIYMQDIILECIAKDANFDRESIDVIVEIINPKNYDVVHNYSVNNVIMSNRYISKMVTQISKKEALYEFYKDILTYDEIDVEDYGSEELYIKKVSHFFEEVPEPCTAAELIRAVYEAGPENNKSLVLGYAKPNSNMVLFSGDQEKIPVELTKQDKLIIFSNH